MSNLEKLNDIYYDAESGFGSLDKLYSQAKAATRPATLCK
jgi:hypothetical protein